MYILTKVQHLKTIPEGASTSDIVSTATYDTREAYLSAYHTEMAYALASEDFLGLSILVTDTSLNEVFKDNWIREIKNEEPDVPDEDGI